MNNRTKSSILLTNFTAFHLFSLTITFDSKMYGSWKWNPCAKTQPMVTITASEVE